MISDKKRNYRDLSSTRKIIIFISLLLCLLTVVALTWRSEGDFDGKIPLIWTTDANPQRGLQVDTFNQMFPDLLLNIDPANNNVMKVMVQCSANMGPDIIGHVNESSFQLYHSAGILMDVTDEAKKMGFGPETLPEQIRPLVMMKVLDENGDYVERQYTYPCNVWHGFIIYNKNLFDKYGVEYPSEDLTWEEYLDKVEKLTIYNEGAQTPEVFGGMDAMGWAKTMTQTLIWEMGGAVMNEDGTRSRFADKETIKALVFYHDLLHKLKAEPTPSSMAGVSGQGGWGNGPINWFGGNKIGMIWGARWMLVSIRRFQMEQKKARKKWLEENPGVDPEKGPQILRMGACRVPRFKNGVRYTPFGARCAGINRHGKNKYEACKFLKYLATKEYCETINQGADSKPGPKQFNKIELFDNPEFPGEEEINKMAIASIENSRLQPRSPFIPKSKVSQIFSKVKDKLVSSDKLTPEEIALVARDASDEIDLIIMRNIKRNKSLRIIYEKMKEKGCKPIRFEEELE